MLRRLDEKKIHISKGKILSKEAVGKAAISR